MVVVVVAVVLVVTADFIVVKVMLRLTVSQSVCLGVKFTLELVTRIIFCLKVAGLFLCGALSDERSGLSLVSHCHQCLVHCQSS
jgi:hypothetical protein